MKIKRGMLGALCAVTMITLPLLACSSSSGGGGYGITNCPALQIPSGCVSCLKSNCGSEVSQVDSACQAYYDCICPSGQDAAVLLSCTPSDSCNQVTDQAMNSCNACANACDSNIVTNGNPDAG